MRYPASEKVEIIELVEQSHLPAKRTLDKLGISRATFYRWYDRYRESGPEALADHRSRPDRIWNRIPVAAGAGGAVHRREEVFCLGSFGLSAAEGARSHHQPGLCGDQSRERVQGQDHRHQPALADRLHLPQDHGLGLVLSVDRARRLLALHRDLEAWSHDVRLRRHGHARSGTRSFRPRPHHRHAATAASERQRIELRRGRSGHVLKGKDMQHVRGAPYHPQTQGKIERWHQTLKNRILLDNYYLPGDLERQIGAFVEHYNNVRYHESINNLTPPTSTSAEPR